MQDWERRLEGLVIQVCKDNPKAVDNDMELLIGAWERQGIELPPKVKTRLLNPRLFSNESLTRMRRKLKERGIVFKPERAMF